jgi:hypothetical protein
VVVRSHVSSRTTSHSLLLEVHVENINMRPDEAIRGKRMTPDGKGRESDVESRDLKGCSIRLCRLRTGGLVLTSKH